VRSKVHMVMVVQIHIFWDTTVCYMLNLLMSQWSLQFGPSGA